MNEKPQQDNNEATDFNSAIDRGWDELDLVDRRIANLEAELQAAKGRNERDLLEQQLAEAKAKRKQESEYLKGFY
jgi:phage shock protein A